MNAMSPALGVVDGIEDRELVRAQLRRAIERSIAVGGRVAPVGARQVVHVARGLGPVPDRDDDVSLEPARTFRPTRRKLAGGDTVRPFPEIFVGYPAELADRLADHDVRRLTGLRAPRPRVVRGREFSERRGKRARREVAELVATRAAQVLPP